MPIKILNLEICIEEAERFLLRARAALKDHRQALKTEYRFTDGKLNAAVRRSSMDLTRALAELRKY